MNQMRFASSAVALTLALFACTGGDDETQTAGDAPAPVVTVPSSSGTPDAGVTANTANTGADAGADAEAPDLGFEPGAFEPSKLADLALWLRADKLKINASDEILGWKDLSSNHNDAVPVASHAPTFFPGANDLPLGVMFDGKQAMTMKDSESLQWKGDFTLMVIAASTQPDGTRGLLYGKTAAASPNTGPALFLNYSSSSKHMFGGQVDSDTFAIWNNQPMDDGKMHLHVFGRKGDELFASVTLDYATTKITKVSDTRAVGADAFLGGQMVQGQLKDGFVGVMWEVVAMQHAASDAEVTNVLKYALARYVTPAKAPEEAAP